MGLKKTIRVVTFNICHGRGTDNRVDLNRTAGVLECAGGELIGLQEVDRFLPRSRFCYQAGYLGRLLGKHWVFGATIKWLPCMQYGNAALSRWPIISWKNRMLPGRGEQRGLLQAEIDMGGLKVDFFCTHLGLNRQERLVQASVILDIVSASRKPAILAGDLNDGRRSPVYSLISAVLREATGAGGELNTFPAENPAEQLDFVFVSGHWQSVSARPVFSGASDHLAVVAEIALN
ncbi:MAG: endonuclease/exonuclease/phosphatase family protein [Peptococcaceae bacterium]|nr:endonuclease/exonuclease/phosphatase family protein [Peptococcaceae bacterium]